MRLGDAGTTMTVDGVMVYTVNGEGRLTSIRGYWEPSRTMASLTGP
jgi:steroid delta-isomerase